MDTTTYTICDVPTQYDIIAGQKVVVKKIKLEIPTNN